MSKSKLWEKKDHGKSLLQHFTKLNFDENFKFNPNYFEIVNLIRQGKRKFTYRGGEYLRWRMLYGRDKILTKE